MKNTLIIICAILFLTACEKDSPDPILNELNGQWKLVKIGIGFPSPTGPKELQPDYVETLEFNASKGSFSRNKDGKTVEKSAISISTDENASIRQYMLVFNDSETYSYISFTETPKYLVLYQPAPIGSTLADGNSFFYEKIK
jgi:hypothetical protein